MQRPLHWSGVAVGAGCTLIFTLAAGLVGAATGSPAAAVASSAVAFFLAGLATTRLLRSAHPVEPAVGAGLITLVFGLVQIALMTEPPAEVTNLQLVVSAVLAGVLSFLLAWTGAVVGIKIHTGRKRSTGQAE